MKKLHRITAALVCLAMLLALAACSGGDSGDNTPPTISGVGDQTVVAGSEFDALAGVTASDKEDGDITSMITITSMPSLTFQNGKAVPASAGSYELTYSVTDKGGETAEAYATLIVTRQTGEAVIFKQMDFSTAPTDSHGWTASIADSYFTVEITAKASKPVSCGFFLNPMGGWDPRISEGIDFTTQEQTFTFDTTDTLILDMDFEMLFQFGSNDLANLGEVTIEFTNITIYQRSVV